MPFGIQFGPALILFEGERKGQGVPREMQAFPSPTQEGLGLATFFAPHTLSPFIFTLPDSSRLVRKGAGVQRWSCRRWGA